MTACPLSKAVERAIVDALDAAHDFGEVPVGAEYSNEENA